MKRATQSAAALGLIFGAIGIPVAVVACGSSSSGTTSAADAGPSDAAIVIDGDTIQTGDGSPGSLVTARPYNFHVPANYDKSKATPLVVMLHGYSASGVVEEAYFDLTATSDAETFLYAYPDGTLDKSGNRFWNADDACCDFDSDKQNIDDVAYINAIIDDVSTKYNVDAKQIFVIGHSNGAFMAHRLACDDSARVAAIVSLAGAVWNDPTKCNPTNKIAVLDIHGDADMTILYDGGTAAAVYPGESQTMSTWAAKNNCTGAITPNGQTLDIDSVLPGNETVETQYAGCPTGIDVELYTIHGGGHVPSLSHPSWGELVWSFFKAHPKP